MARAPAAAVVREDVPGPGRRADALADTLRAAVEARSGAGPILQREVGIRTGDKTWRVGPGGYDGDLTSTARGNVAGMFFDEVEREFHGWEEFESYVSGATDYIGEVVTDAGDHHWYRLREDELSVLGESHHHPHGNVLDVLKALRTSRFMYEPLNTLQVVGPQIEYEGTDSRLAEIQAGLTTGLTLSSRWSNDLESAVLKAMSAMFMITGGAGESSKSFVEEPDSWRWEDDSSGSGMGERTAFYLALAIRMAADVARQDWSGKDQKAGLVKESAALKEAYAKHKGMLEPMRLAKESDAAMGIRTLVGRHKVSDLVEFADAFVVWGSRHTVLLAKQLGSDKLGQEAAKLQPGRGLTLVDMDAAREALMWQRILEARDRGYLLVGMGDTHRVNLRKQLREEGIRHADVQDDIRRGERQVRARWVDPPEIPQPTVRPEVTPTFVAPPPLHAPDELDFAPMFGGDEDFGTTWTDDLDFVPMLSGDEDFGTTSTFESTLDVGLPPGFDPERDRLMMSTHVDTTHESTDVSSMPPGFDPELDRLLMLAKSTTTHN